jgi:cardiolipin synthase
MKRSIIPNTITCLRIILTAPIVWALLQQKNHLAWWLFIFAGFTDAVDGVAARLLNATSRLGSILDPLADKLLLIGTTATLGYLREIPYWFMWLLIARDLWIVAGATTFYFCLERIDMQPSWISKCHTLLQIAMIWALLSKDYDPGLLDEHWINMLVMFTLATTIVSFIDYTWVFGRRTCQHLQKRKFIKQGNL